MTQVKNKIGSIKSGGNDERRHCIKTRSGRGVCLVLLLVINYGVVFPINNKIMDCMN